MLKNLDPNFRSGTAAGMDLAGQVSSSVTELETHCRSLASQLSFLPPVTCHQPLHWATKLGENKYLKFVKVSLS